MTPGQIIGTVMGSCLGAPTLGYLLSGGRVVQVYGTEPQPARYRLTCVACGAAHDLGANQCGYCLTPYAQALPSMADERFRK